MAPRPPAASVTRFRPGVTAVTALAVLTSPLDCQEAPLTADRWNRAAIEWIGLLRDGDFDAAAARVDPEVPEDAMSAESLGTIWAQVSGQFGALVSLEPGPVTGQGEYHVVDLAGTFENQALTVRVVLTDALEVSGFFFRPPEPPPYETPAYVDTTAFREIEVTVGEAPWELPGTLTIPVVPGATGASEMAGAGADGPFPGMVLVHGSGPNDRDETVGGNRPFRDLAWGLASSGVAVLRYDKRTRVHGPSLPADIGLDEEVVDDAVSALELLRERPEVDGERVFVLGHSLGGLMAPTIAERDGRIAGVIVAAGPARPFHEVIVEQIEYIAGLDADASEETGLDSLVAEVRRWSTGDPEPDATLLGAPVSYWNEVAAVEPVATARSLAVPILVLQGGRDYQVTEADLALWREGLEDRADVTFELFPDLNHLLMPGQGMATPAEYTTEVKHVDPAVIDRIASWVAGARLVPRGSLARLSYSTPFGPSIVDDRFRPRPSPAVRANTCLAPTMDVSPLHIPRSSPISDSKSSRRASLRCPSAMRRSSRAVRGCVALTAAARPSYFSARARS